jgi:hypothetical protein
MDAPQHLLGARLARGGSHLLGSGGRSGGSAF